MFTGKKPLILCKKLHRR